MGQKDRLPGLKEKVIIGPLIPAGTGLPARREQLECMPKPRPLAAVFGAEEEELPALPAEEDRSVEDLEDEDEEEETVDISTKRSGRGHRGDQGVAGFGDGT